MTPAEVKEVVYKALKDQPKLDEDQIQAIVEASVKATLTTLGIRHEDPLEMQMDFAHLRRWRKSVGQVTSLGVMTVISTLVVGVLGAMWLGLSQMLGK